MDNNIIFMYMCIEKFVLIMLYLLNRYDSRLK
jgi:hypothetical protein